MKPVLEVLNPGPGVTVQDGGRRGWRRFGIPEGGAMDRGAAMLANRLAGNDGEAAVLEILLGPARFRVLDEAEFALTGAGGLSNGSHLRAFKVRAGGEIAVGHPRDGVWSYLAIQGGFAGARWFGSASTNERAGFGSALPGGARLARRSPRPTPGIAGRFSIHWEDYSQAPAIPIWKGPEWTALRGLHGALCEEKWTVSARSDRSGYRLEAAAARPHDFEMPSGPVSVGTIQVPPDGRPVVIMRDGPTVGGYPRVAIVDPVAISRLAQCAPGSDIRFHLVA